MSNYEAGSMYLFMCISMSLGGIYIIVLAEIERHKEYKENKKDEKISKRLLE